MLALLSRGAAPLGVALLSSGGRESPAATLLSNATQRCIEKIAIG